MSDHSWRACSIGLCRDREACMYTPCVSQIHGRMVVAEGAKEDPQALVEKLAAELYKAYWLVAMPNAGFDFQFDAAHELTKAGWRGVALRAINSLSPAGEFRQAVQPALMASQLIPTSSANAAYERDLRAAAETSQKTEKPDES